LASAWCPPVRRPLSSGCARGGQWCRCVSSVPVLATRCGPYRHGNRPGGERTTRRAADLRRGVRPRDSVHFDPGPSLPWSPDGWPSPPVQAREVDLESAPLGSPMPTCSPCGARGLGDGGEVSGCGCRAVPRS
jgi:hypothetical protein